MFTFYIHKDKARENLFLGTTIDLHKKKLIFSQIGKDNIQDSAEVIFTEKKIEYLYYDSSKRAEFFIDDRCIERPLVKYIGFFLICEKVELFCRCQ